MEKIYKHYDDVPFTADKSVHHDNQGKLEEVLKIIQDGDKAGGWGNLILPFQDRLLALLLLPFLLTSDEKISILDFGGALGLDYFSVLTQLIPVNEVLGKYYVVELPDLVATGKKELGAFESLVFLDSLPEDLPVEIIIARSTMQFIRNYKEVIEQFCAYNPTFIYFSGLPITGGSEYSTFAIAQTRLENKSVPYWIFSFKEIADLLFEKNYGLLYRAVDHVPNWVSKYRNLPYEEWRVLDMNLIFVRRVIERT